MTKINFIQGKGTVESSFPISEERRAELNYLLIKYRDSSETIKGTLDSIQSHPDLKDEEILYLFYKTGAAVGAMKIHQIDIRDTREVHI